MIEHKRSIISAQLPMPSSIPTPARLSGRYFPDLIPETANRTLQDNVRKTDAKQNDSKIIKKLSRGLQRSLICSIRFLRI